jgi:hypothetical protein
MKHKLLLKNKPPGPGGPDALHRLHLDSFAPDNFFNSLMNLGAYISIITDEQLVEINGKCAIEKVNT